MAAPDTLTISKVGKDDQNRQKIKLKGQGETAFGIFDPDDALTAVAEGVEFKGWVNMEGQYGPYVRVAKPQGQQQTMNGGSEAVEGDKPSQEYWEAKDRRIQRGGVHKVAVVLYRIGLEASIYKTPTSEQQMVDDLASISNRLDQDIFAAGDRKPDSDIPF